MNKQTEELLGAIGVVIAGLVAFILLFVVLGIISTIGSNILTLCLQYTLPIAVVVYLV